MVFALAGDSTMTRELAIPAISPALSQFANKVLSRQLLHQAAHFQSEQRRQHARLRKRDRSTDRIHKECFVSAQYLEDGFLVRLQTLLEERSGLWSRCSHFRCTSR